MLLISESFSRSWLSHIFVWIFNRSLWYNKVITIIL